MTELGSEPKPLSFRVHLHLYSLLYLFKEIISSRTRLLPCSLRLWSTVIARASLCGSHQHPAVGSLCVHDQAHRTGFFNPFYITRVISLQAKLKSSLALTPAVAAHVTSDNKPLCDCLPWPLSSLAVLTALLWAGHTCIPMIP